MKTKTHVLLLIAILFIACKQTNKQKKVAYSDQIGDTIFNAQLDDPNFQFCDSTAVLHKRAYVSYIGGEKALQEAIKASYTFKPEYSSFSGYLIVRFAVNCRNISGRIRIQSLDNDFNLSECPKSLRQHIQTIFKSLDNWNHAIYRGEDYDCYAFHVIRINNGKIQHA